MSASLSQNTYQKQVQQPRLILTQELQLFLRLIQMTTMELREYLEEQLIENPVLEEIEEQADKDDGNVKEEFDLGDLAESRVLKDGNGDLPHYSPMESFDNGEEETPWENRISNAESLIDHLEWQVKVSDFSLEEKQIATIIIGNTNDDGYLELSAQEIASTFLREGNGKSPKRVVAHDKKLLEKINSVLKRIQSSFNPTGVCARDLKESLEIQVLELGYSKDDLIFKLIDNHLEVLDKKDVFQIAEEFRATAEEVQNALLTISTLEPKPGRPFYKKDSESHIVPDFYVHKVGEDLQIQLNRDFPKVRISNYYRNLVKNQQNLPPDTKQFVKEKLEAAQRIMKCLDEREVTVRKIITKIAETQRDFFENGKDHIKPLILKDVARSVGVHESTVSRITSRRYIQTPQGTIKLKSLFSRKIETAQGREVSFEKVKSLIRNIISNELQHSPYSDEDISKMLRRRDVKVARRTVAKYRKVLRIPASSVRANKNGKAQNENNGNDKTY